MTSPISAANAYASLARMTEAGKGPGGGIGAGLGKAASGPDFGDVLKQALGAVAQVGRTSDAQTETMVQTGKSNVVDVVTAVAETETAIDALVAVRDRVIASYEEIMRMPI